MTNFQNFKVPFKDLLLRLNSTDSKLKQGRKLENFKRNIKNLRTNLNNK